MGGGVVVTTVTLIHQEATGGRQHASRNSPEGGLFNLSLTAGGYMLPGLTVTGHFYSDSGRINQGAPWGFEAVPALPFYSSNEIDHDPSQCW